MAQFARHKAAPCIGQHLHDGLGLEVRNDIPRVRLELRQRALGQHLARILQRAQHDVLDACLRTVLVALNLKHQPDTHGPVQSTLACQLTAACKSIGNLLTR